MGALEVQPAEHRVKDLSDVDNIDALLERYQRAGEVMAAAKKFRAQTRAQIFEALGDAHAGQTSRWLLMVQKRFRAGYTVRDHYRHYLLIAAVDDGEADDGEAG
jgi:hypothetical protein